MNSSQFRRYLAKQGCTFEPSGHQIVFLGDRRSILPMHGGRKQLGEGLVKSIKKDLGIK